MPWHYIRHNRRVFFPRIYIAVGWSFARDHNGSIPYPPQLGRIEALLVKSRKGGGPPATERRFWHNGHLFWAWLNRLAKPKTSIRVIMWRPGLFLRISGFFTFAKKAGWQFGLPIANSNYFSLKVRAQGTIHIIASTNFLPRVSLAQVPPDQQAAFLHRLMELLRDLCVKRQLGNWAPSLPRLAWNFYRHKFMSYPLLHHEDPELWQSERAAYRGGRCEARYIGHITQPVWYLDANSMYGWAMLHGLYPVRPVAMYPSLTLRELRAALKRYAVIARVYLNTPEPAYAVRRGNLTIWPVGRFWATLTTPELAYALAHGHIQKVGLTAIYTRAPIFRAFVKYFGALKEQAAKTGNKLLYLVAKLCIAMLHGKLGQTKRITRKLPPLPAWAPPSAKMVDAHTGQISTLVKFGDHAWEVARTDQPADHALTAVAAHVTAYARMRQWALIRRAGLQNVFYCDTDSLFVNAAGLANLRRYVHPTRLGCLKVVDTSPGMLIFGRKNYRFGKFYKAAGVPAGAEWLRPDLAKAIRILRLPTAIKQGRPEAVQMQQVLITAQKKYREGWQSPPRLTE